MYNYVILGTKYVNYLLSYPEKKRDEEQQPNPSNFDVIFLLWKFSVNLLLQEQRLSLDVFLLPDLDSHVTTTKTLQ